MLKRYFFVFLIILMFCSLSLNAYAAQFNPTFRDYYNNDWPASPGVVWQHIDIYSRLSGTKDEEYLFTYPSESYFFERSIGDVNYNFTSATFKSNMPSGSSLDGLVFYVPTKWLFTSYKANYFDCIEFYFAINYFCSSEVFGYDVVPEVSINSIKPNGSTPFHSFEDGEVIYDHTRTFKVAKIASGARDSTNKSVTVIYKASFQSEYYTDYFDDWSNSTISFHFYDTISNSNIKEIDFGFIDGQIGADVYREYVMPDFENHGIWEGVPDSLPAVPSVGSLPQVSSIFESVNKFKIVTSIFVPIGLTAISYFTLRIILWKGV